MRDTVLARRYATAIFEMAQENNIIDRMERDIELIKNIISEHPDWAVALDDAEIPIEIKLKMIDEVSAASGFHLFAEGLLKILAEKRMVHLSPEVIDGYRNEALRSKGEIEAQVTVADGRVWKELKEEIGLAVTRISGKKARPICRVDPSIIGGLVVRIDDVVYDGSIRGELKRFKDNLIKKVGEV